MSLKTASSKGKLSAPLRTVAVAAMLSIVAVGCDNVTGPDTKIVEYEIAEYQVSCQGFIPQMCLLVREHPSDSYTYFYDGIVGFTYEPGYHYRVSVRIESIEHPYPDQSSFRYVLVSLQEKTRAT